MEGGERVRAIEKEREKDTLNRRGRPSRLSFVNRLWISGKMRQESKENGNKKARNKKDRKTDSMNERKQQKEIHERRKTRK